MRGGPWCGLELDSRIVMDEKVGVDVNAER